MSSKERVYLTAISIDGGIITLIEENGSIENYRQRGIQKLTDCQRNNLIHLGVLFANWRQYRELPAHYSIEFEDEEIQGRAQANFPNQNKVRKFLASKGIRTD